ncbi:universal stress protein [Streptomyces sp. NPDC020379]|uniref:universal stress protein n=1 Tax=Streptomyces sp. NPDC020379 TaxID=3365071 RepID=UPI00379FDA84
MSEIVQRVIVGVNGSAGSVAALQQAAREAARHDAVLCPVIAWAPPGGEAADAVNPAPLDVRAYWERAARDRLTETCDDALDADTRRGLKIYPRVVRAQAGPALVALSRHEKDMLVMGAGSHGPVHRFLHGSVSRHCLKHAHCPVLVVHPEETDGEAAPDGGPHSRPRLAPTAAPAHPER